MALNRFARSITRDPIRSGPSRAHLRTVVGALAVAAAGLVAFWLADPSLRLGWPVSFHAALPRPAQARGQSPLAEPDGPAKVFGRTFRGAGPGSRGHGAGNVSLRAALDRSYRGLCRPF